MRYKFQGFLRHSRKYDGPLVAGMLRLEGAYADGDSCPRRRLWALITQGGAARPMGRCACPGLICLSPSGYTSARRVSNILARGKAKWPPSHAAPPPVLFPIGNLLDALNLTNSRIEIVLVLVLSEAVLGSIVPRQSG
jgi:hypothetical protein